MGIQFYQWLYPAENPSSNNNKGLWVHLRHYRNSQSLSEWFEAILHSGKKKDMAAKCKSGQKSIAHMVQGEITTVLY